MPISKIAKSLWIASAVGLLVFLATNVVPMAAGDDPSATTHVVDRSEAERVAEAYVRSRVGDAGAEFRSFAMYAADRDVFGYFYEAETIADVQRRWSGTLPLEAYRVEVEDVGSGAKHWVDVNPYTGKATEWSLAIAGEPVARGELEAIGRRTLADLGWTGAEPELLRADEDVGEAAYALSDPAFGEASAEVSVRADELGATAFTVRWIVPESYASRIADQDAKSSALGLIGLLLSGVLQFAAFIYALAQAGSVRWNRGVLMALVFGVFYCAMNVNMYPGLKATMLDLLNGGDYAALSELDGAGAIAGMIGGLVVTNALTLAMAIGLYFSAVAGDTLAARQGYRLWPQPEDAGYGSHVANAVKLGYLYAPILLGVQSILFLFAEQGFRTWYTIDALSSPNNMAYPLLAPLLAWCAAVSEEAVYRLFAIAALKRLFAWPLSWALKPLGASKRTVGAVALVGAILISSMVWALGHVQYPIYPYYTRFAEVTALGLLFAFIFLRHGFLAAVFAHAVVDLIWFGISVVSSAPTAGGFAAFAFYLTTPALIALYVNRSRRDRPAAPVG